MKKLLLLSSFFIFLFSIFLLITPDNAYAKPPKPVLYQPTANCVNGQAQITLSWDTSLYDADKYTWDLVINGGSKIPVNNPSDSPYSWKPLEDEPGTAYEWKIQNGEKGCWWECENSTQGTPVTRPSCSGDETPPGGACAFCENRTGYKNGFIQNYWGGPPCDGLGFDCIPQDLTDTEYCQYDNAQDGGKPLITAVSRDTCSTGEVCREVGGCVASGSDNPDACKTINERTTCDGNDICQNNDGQPRPNCLSSYCIDSEDGRIFSEKDKEEGKTTGRCSYVENPEDLQEGREAIECEPDNPDTDVIEGNAAEKCSSGYCNEDGQCSEGYSAYNCVKQPNGTFVCKTAIGRINTSPDNFVRILLRLLLGISGGILLVLMILNGYKYMTSQGDPEKVKDARDGIIAALAGILLIIFSLSILQLITVDILGLPGFSR